jgi:hypothetical protein
MAFTDIVAGITGGMAGLGTLAKDIRTAITGKEPISQEKAAELAIKAQELEMKALEADNALMLGQIEINKIEAGSASKFVSGWRPFLGWVLSICCGLYFVPRFLLGMTMWTILAVKAMSSGALPALPDLGWGDLATLLGGILGLATLRSVEKAKGVARS